MSVEDFLSMRPCDFWLKYEYFLKQRIDDYKHTASIVRTATAVIINLFAKKPITDLEKFWPLTTEPQKVSQMTEEERKNSIEHLKKLLDGKATQS